MARITVFNDDARKDGMFHHHSSTLSPNTQVQYSTTMLLQIMLVSENSLRPYLCFSLKKLGYILLVYKVELVCLNVSK